MVMECNRDEARRAKRMAEKKFADKDYGGAKKFTLKAQRLYPGLDGVSQMLMILNVYISSEKKVNGESDWYGVLDVNPNDDDETIRKQYKKLVLLLHPDKNKSMGADAAFKIVSEAWRLLSDKTKRSAYNRRRKFPEKVSSANRTSSEPASGPEKRTSSKAASGPEKDSFWTVCHRCKMRFEFEKVYMNRTLLCNNCHKPFDAVELATPINSSKPPAGSESSDYSSSGSESPDDSSSGSESPDYSSSGSSLDELNRRGRERAKSRCFGSKRRKRNS